MVARVVPAATEVLPGWWLGGRYASELGLERRGAVVDLTVEFDEGCIDTVNATATVVPLTTWRRLRGTVLLLWRF